MGYFEEAIETFPSSIAQALDRAEGISDKQAKCERLCDVANELIMFFAQMLISEYLEMRESTRNEEIENLLGRIETRPHYTLGTHNEIVLGIWREIGKSSILGHEITRPLGDLPELKQFIETWRKIRSIWFEFHESIERFDHRRGIDKFSGFTGRRQEFKLFDYFSELVQLRNSFSHKDAFPVSCNGIQIYVNLTRIHTSFYDVIGDNLQASLIRFCGLFGPVLSRYREAQVLDVRFENRRRLVEIREIFGLAGLTRRSTTSVVSDNEVEKSELWLYDKLDKKLLRKMTLRTDRYPAPWRKPEHSSRLEGYKVLRHLYPEGAREMLRSSEGKGSPMVPIYVFTDTDINVIFKLDKNPWPNDDHVKRLGKARLEQLVSHDPGFVKRNRWKVRLADISVTEGELTLYVSPVLYHYYLATNLAVAHNEKDIDNSHVLLRNRLVPDDSSIKLHPSALCSNHIGISALVVSVDGNIILPISSEMVFS